jgi:diphthamide synthase
MAARLPKAFVSWSSGKDSAYALLEARRQSIAEIVGIITTIDTADDRVAIHGVRQGLLTRQAAALGLPLIRVQLPHPCPNEVYETQFLNACASIKAQGIEHIGFRQNRTLMPQRKFLATIWLPKHNFAFRPIFSVHHNARMLTLVLTCSVSEHVEDTARFSGMLTQRFDFDVRFEPMKVSKAAVLRQLEAQQEGLALRPKQSCVPSPTDVPRPQPQRAESRRPSYDAQCH